MNFDNIRRCSTPGGSLEISKCPIDPDNAEELSEYYYKTPGVIYKELYYIHCKHGKISTGSFGRTIEEVVELWNIGRTCEEVWSKEELKLGKADRK